MDLVETSRVEEEEERGQAMDKARRQKEQFNVDWKWIAVGGVALACGLHSSAIGKALMVGAGQRLARRPADQLRVAKLIKDMIARAEPSLLASPGKDVYVRI
ncbi:hypothetical protein Bca52824_020475 [Brassica carinata]|uniref:Uncharacterized protein n=1 Tax=Brassica carinata TaxID=52824 RepID=A0A8X7VUZ1_BRACI|nr:hypothetical protein Bca52824_020475 [Brassica carinata]